ncbi:MAG: hypothetical protein H6748_07010 [Spirochaetaceae bacterium]|nr:hypothetical protein [Myxococcales bacterium]MCB9723774.1 hypothetical protein [Spirochaetaceae bacterium]
MAKLTIEIDMEDPQEAWDALYRRIEEFGEESETPGVPPAAQPVTYDLLLDPERLPREPVTGPARYFVFDGRE